LKPKKAAEPGRGLVPVQGAAPQLPAQVLPPRAWDVITLASSGILASNSKRAFLSDARSFLGEHYLNIQTQALWAVGPANIAAFRDRLIAAGQNPGTVSRKISSLRYLYEWAIALGWTRMNPADKRLVKAPKQGNIRKMDWLDEGELRTLLDSIDLSVREGRRDHALIMVAIHMGLRRSEVVSIQRSQFKRAGDRGYIVFRSKGQKERIVWLNASAEDALRAWDPDVPKSCPWIFPGRSGGHLSGDQMRRIVVARLKAAGITKRVGTHGLRATFITVNIMKGTPLQEVQTTVGHSEPATTLGYAREIEALKSKAPEAMEGYGAPLRPKEPKKGRGGAKKK